MTHPAIDARALTKEFGTAEVVKSLDLRLDRGTVLGLLGPNGSGKTTTVRMLATLLRPTSGTVRVCGLDLRTHPDRIRAKIGLAGQFSAIDPHLTGVENLEFIARLVGYRRRAVRSAANDLLERFGLTGAAGEPARTYSGGMRRRLDLAATFLTEPEVLFLDEPTTGLDPLAREGMWDLVRSRVEQGCSVLLTTQYLEEADALADDVIVLNHGRKVAEGPPEELKRLSGDPVLMLRARADLADRLHTVLTEQERPVVSHESSTVGITVPGHSIAGVIAAVQDAGVVLESVSMREPDLDDVFRNLVAKEG